MAHPVFWPSKTFFYPIGNTSPVCLTQYLAPEENANVLLLGCGDPRNILYTLSSERTNIRQKYDFTCCDIEPAILARNVLLYTLIADDATLANFSNIWNIFYHYFLDPTSLSLLFAQCRKLVALSDSLETWNSGKYSHFLRMCSRHTLSELNRYWSLYVGIDSYLPAQKKELKDKFVTSMKEIARVHDGSVHISSARSAGPLWLHAVEVVSDACRQFWDTGVLLTDRADIAAAVHVNPTFAFAIQGEGFMAHYGTAPLASFHLAPAFTPIRSTPKTRRGQPTVADVYQMVKAQFSEWCRTFQSSVLESDNDTQKVVIRLLVGDVLASCHTLNRYIIDRSITAHHGVAPWKATPLVLDGGDYESKPSHVPQSFNVIDTSNLSDHIGLLNILVSSIPLLSRTPSAALYTETLLTSGKDSTTAFPDRLCGDIATISLLLDIVPSAFVSNFTSQSNVHEILAYRMIGDLHSIQYHERMVWRIPSVMDRADHLRSVTFDSHSLAHLLFNVYLKMFSFENIREQMKNISLQSLRDSNLIYYCRGSFALFIRLVKSRIVADWDKAVDLLLLRIEQDRDLLVGPNQFQDFVCQLHLLNVYSVDVLKTGHPMLHMNRTGGRLRNLRSVPPVVCVVMVVPRDMFRALEEESDRVVNPHLHAEIDNSRFNNSFQCIQPIFGTAVVEPGDGDSPVVIIHEDPLGRLGCSSVIVSFWVPSWILCADPESTSVSLGIQSSPQTTLLIPKLGLSLRLFSVSLKDTQHLYVVRELPRLSQANRCAANYTLPPLVHHNSTTTIRVTLDDSCRLVTSLVARADMTDADAKAALKDRSLEIKTTPASPCSVLLSIGTAFKQNLLFPFPINAINAKTRVARQSCYIEVVVSLSHSNFKGGMTMKRFPIVRTQNQLNLWNMHYINLAHLPILDTTNQAKVDWLNPHISLMLSDRERALRNDPSKPASTLDAMLNLKDSIHTVLLRFSTLGSRTFSLHRSSGGDVDTIIFMMGLRLDLPNHVVVADIFVLPLTEDLVKSLIPALGPLDDSLVHVAVTDEEVTAWKHFLPAAVERCRDWAHKANCAYLERGAIPLSEEFSQIPICDCGRGQGVQEFVKTKSWKPFAPYVTRAVISPLFAVSYMETVGGAAAQLADNISGEVRRQSENNEPKVQDGSNTRGRCGRCNRLPHGPQEKFMVCGRCKVASYCSKDCQTAHWRTHKATCK